MTILAILGLLCSLRTFRLSVVEGVDYASTSVGNLLSGPLFLSVGYYGVFGISGLCNIIALLLVIGFLKESVVQTEVEEQENIREGLKKV